MTTGYNPLLRNAQLDAITAFAGAGAKLRIYAGTRPTTGGAVGTLLAEFALASPFAPSAANGALAVTAPAGVTASATGTAAWFRINKADGTTFVMDGAVGTDLILDNTSITSGASVAINSFAINRGNA